MTSHVSFYLWAMYKAFCSQYIEPCERFTQAVILYFLKFQNSNMWTLRKYFFSLFLFLSEICWWYYWSKMVSIVDRYRVMPINGCVTTTSKFSGIKQQKFSLFHICYKSRIMAGCAYFSYCYVSSILTECGYLNNISCSFF